MDLKKLAAEKAVEFVKNGMIVGLGTGSTVNYAIKKLGERVKEGLEIKAIATSKASEDLAKELSIHLTTFSEIKNIDLTIDGADEVDPFLNLIKGGGGALLREKIVAWNSSRFIVVVDESKLVNKLGKFPLPVEVIPFGADLTLKKISESGAKCEIRLLNKKPYITDNGNFIADCQFYPIESPTDLDNMLKRIPGVVETGLFLSSMVTAVITARSAGVVEIISN